MNVFFVASEAEPYAKTGGLGDVCGALPRALADMGHDITLVLPKYRQIDNLNLPISPCAEGIRVPLGDQVVNAEIWRAEAENGLHLLFVGNETFFGREGLYGERGLDYPDNAQRFFFFCKAVLEYLIKSDTRVDILHCNEWQTALLPVYLKTLYRDSRHLRDTKSVFTIHNLGYQGIFDSGLYHLTNLSWDYFNPKQFEHFGMFNLLKGAILYADRLTTVSPTYADEVQHEEFGFGLQGDLHNRRADLSGILDRIDTRIWDPTSDIHLPQNYSAANLRGKAACKAALQARFNLPQRADVPLFGMTTRLTEQKGLELCAASCSEVLQNDIQVVILGRGDQKYHIMLNTMSNKEPQKLAVKLEVDDPLAHLLIAGCDFYLMPSRYEPCGLHQMYSMHYGTVPIVRGVGGLQDTVIDLEVDAQNGNGFKFGAFEPPAMQEKLGQALALFADKGRLAEIQLRGMQQDFSWEKSARQYAAIYKNLTD